MPENVTGSEVGVSMGASFLGFATHFGFLRGLIAGGEVPAAVAGSSAGAIIAGLYAAGLPLEDIEAAATRKDLKQQFRESTFPLRALGTFLGRPGFPAVLLGTRLHRMLSDLVGDLRLEDCKKARLHIAVTNLRTHKVEVRSTGPLVEMILASCALPGLLAPRLIEGELLWDGGLGCVVPIEQWIDDPSITCIVSHNLLHEEQIQGRLHPERLSFPGAMMAGHQLAADEILRWKSELARRMGKRVVSIETVTPRPRLGPPITARAPKPWHLHSRDFIAAGEAAAQRALAQLKTPEAFSGADETPEANC